MLKKLKNYFLIAALKEGLEKVNRRCLYKTVFFLILLIGSVFFLSTGCAKTDQAGQSWKTALTTPLKGRNNSNQFVEENDQNEVTAEETDMDNVGASQGDIETESNAEITFEYIDDTNWVKSEWPDEYAYMKGLDWNKQEEVRENGNIQRVLDALSALEGNWPGVSQREIPLKSLKEESESYYGDHIWYAGIYLNRIEKIEEGSEDAKAINNGKAYAVLHASCTLGDEENEILMYIMNLDNFDSFYSDDDVGEFVNITGWYVGETDGKPSIAYPGLAGG